MRHNRYNKKPKGKSFLKNSRSNKGYKVSFFNKTWFQVTSVATTLIASSAIMYGAVSSQPAQAFSVPGIDTFLGAIGIAKQADALSAAWRINIEQTARSAPDIGKRIIDSQYKNAATITGEKQGQKILEVYEDSRPGAGISMQMTCTPQADRTAQVTKDVVKRAATQNDMNSAASTYTQTSISKRGERAYEHINYFCDVSETAQGLCLPRPNGLGGADSNYSNISQNSVLTDETEQAAYAYINNVIDPVSSELDDCDSHACDSIKTTNTTYKALASMSQNAFVNQINDSKVLYAGQGSGATASDDNEEKEAVSANTGDSGDSKEANTNSEDKPKDAKQNNTNASTSKEPTGSSTKTSDNSKTSS